MAIAGYNSVESTNNVPFNNDSGQVLNEGDMLYWNNIIQAFEAGPGIFKLSNLENDLGYLTESEVVELIAGLQSGGTLDLSSYATDTEVAEAINTAIGQLNSFSGDYNDLINKPALFSGSYTDLTNRPALFSGYYEDLQNKPDLSQYATINQVNQAIANIDYDYLVTEAELANALQNIDYSNFVTDAELANAIANIQTGGTVDLSGYVTDAELATAIANIQHPTNISTFINDANYVTVSALNTTLANYQPTVDLSGYVTDAELTTALSNYQPAVDLSGYATTSYVDDQIATALTGGTVDLSSYVTETELTTALSNYQPTVDLSGYVTDLELSGVLTSYYNASQVDQLIANINTGGGTSNVQNLNDLSDVAIGSLPQVDRADDFYLLEYNPITQLWESRNFGGVFATEAYVSSTVATALTNGTINLDGYATEQYVEQKLLERGPHFSGDYNDLVNTPQLFSGNYNDLTNKPTMPNYTLVRDGNLINLVETAAEPDTIAGTINLNDLGIGFSGDYNDLTNKPNLFSGNYDDLANKPYIPSIAGLATVNYVDNRWAEPVITGDRTFTGSVTFEDYVQQKLSTVNSTSTKRDLVLAVQTTNDIETEVLFSDASRVGIVAGTTAMFKATVVASSGADKTAFIVKGVVDYTGTLSIVGNNIVETISDSDLGWTANLTADTVNEALKITVTGSAATVVDWTVFLEISEVIR